MFDFCKLEVYQRAKAICILMNKLIFSGKFDRTTNDQLRHASFSIMLNIAEGSSRFSIAVYAMHWRAHGNVSWQAGKWFKTHLNSFVFISF
jgi:hypothetical protein